MKYKNVVKLFAILTMVVLLISLCACNNEKVDKKTAEEQEPQDIVQYVYNMEDPCWFDDAIYSVKKEKTIKIELSINEEDEKLVKISSNDPTIATVKVLKERSDTNKLMIEVKGEQKGETIICAKVVKEEFDENNVKIKEIETCDFVKVFVEYETKEFKDAFVILKDELINAAEKDEKGKFSKYDEANDLYVNTNIDMTDKKAPTKDKYEIIYSNSTDSLILKLSPVAYKENIYLSQEPTIENGNKKYKLVQANVQDIIEFVISNSEEASNSYDVYLTKEVSYLNGDKKVIIANRTASYMTVGHRSMYTLLTHLDLAISDEESNGYKNMKIDSLKTDPKVLNILKNNDSVITDLKGTTKYSGKTETEILKDKDLEKEIVKLDNIENYIESAIRLIDVYDNNKVYVNRLLKNDDVNDIVVNYVKTLEEKNDLIKAFKSDEEIISKLKSEYKDKYGKLKDEEIIASASALDDILALPNAGLYFYEICEKNEKAQLIVLQKIYDKLDLRNIDDILNEELNNKMSENKSTYFSKLLNVANEQVLNKFGFEILDSILLAND